MSTFATTNGKSIKDAWWEFHKKNPHIYELFEKEVYRAIRAGKRKLSSKMIINFIRWNLYIETSSPDGFKINDAYTAYYARLFMHNHPEHMGIFETRKLRS